MVLAYLLFGVGQSLPRPLSRQSGHLVINEVLASNGTGLMDEDGDFSDWIEIYNPNTWAINLSGWALTDEPNQPQKWLFPDVVLGSGDYLLIFASGKDRRPAEAGLPLHTNFKLGKTGEFLALYDILGQQFADTVSTPFPRQFRDISYGRYGEGKVFGYLGMPSPGSPNDGSTAWANVVEKVKFSVERGFYDIPFLVELTTTTPQATIRYTTDGSEPTDSYGTVYSEPIAIAETTLIRAIAFGPEWLPSPVDTHSYIFLDDVLTQPPNPPGFPETWGIHSRDYEFDVAGEPVIADYEMDPDIVNDPRYKETIKEALKSLPTISIVGDRQGFDIYANPTKRGVDWERPASVELIQPDSSKEGFQINAGLRIQGGQGRFEYNRKHSFRLFFREKYGASKLAYPLFEDSPVTEFDTFILRGGVSSSYAGISLIDHKLSTYSRDEWVRRSQIALSGTGSHGIFVHLYLNGLYWGLYNVVERPDESFNASYLGGKKDDWFVVNQGGPIRGLGHRFNMLYELAEAGSLEDSEKYKIISQYLDIAHFIDYTLVNWYVGNQDWPDTNWYASVQNPAGQVRYFVWDAEYTWIHGADVRFGHRENHFKALFQALIENPDFKMAFADRTFKHLFNDGVLTDAKAQARWMALNQEIDRAIVGESARWGDARFESPINRDDWVKARDGVLAQMEGNGRKLISLLREAGYYPLIDPPHFNQHQAPSAYGLTVTMTSPPLREAGETAIIYYTLDGTDPRMAITGEVAPSALVYDSPLVLTSTTQLRARIVGSGPAGASTKQAHKIPSGQVWSALNEATFTVNEEDEKLCITEIMYNPVGGSAYEFIELKNCGQDDIDLSNLHFEGIDFTFPAAIPPLEVGQLIVLTSNSVAFAERYPNVIIHGVYNRQLSNGGEKITLKDLEGNIVTVVTYDDERGWPVTPDGQGDSLVNVNPNGNPDDPKNWRASQNLNGSPGVDDLQQQNSEGLSP